MLNKTIVFYFRLYRKIEQLKFITLINNICIFLFIKFENKKINLYIYNDVSLKNMMKNYIC